MTRGRHNLTPIKCKENCKENLEGPNFIGLKVFRVEM
jgi:hypothetical protein